MEIKKILAKCVLGFMTVLGLACFFYSVYNLELRDFVLIGFLVFVVGGIYGIAWAVEILSK